MPAPQQTVHTIAAENEQPHDGQIVGKKGQNRLFIVEEYKVRPQKQVIGQVPLPKCVGAVGRCQPAEPPKPPRPGEPPHRSKDHAPMEAQVEAHENKAPVGTEKVNLPGQGAPAPDMQAGKDMVRQDDPAGHQTEHSQKAPNHKSGLNGPVGCISPPVQALQPSAVQNQVDQEQQKHSHADPLMGCLADQ